MRTRIYYAIFVIFAAILSACSFNIFNPVDKPVESEDFMMGTVINQRVYGTDAQAAVDETRGRLKAIENLMTINAPGGDINKLNDAAGKNEPVVLSQETINVLEAAKKYGALSNGAFDVTNRTSGQGMGDIYRSSAHTAGG